MKKENNEKTVILGPGGEDREIFLNLLEFAGLAVTRPMSERCYSAEIKPNSVFAYPALIVFTRSNRVAQLMEENPKQVAAGITGANILREQNIISATSLDFAELLPWTEPTFFSGFATPNSVMLPELYRIAKPIEWGSFMPADQEREILRSTLQRLLPGTTIYTSFPRATRDFFGSADVIITQESGKIEGLWQINPNNLVIFDVSASRATAIANKLRLLLDESRVDKLGVVINSQVQTSDARIVMELIGQILKLSGRMGEIDPRIRPPVSLAGLSEVDSIKYFFIAGENNQGNWTLAPVLFDEYWQTAERAQALLKTKGSIYRRVDQNSQRLLRRLEATAEPEIISMINYALQKNGYLLIPEVFINYLRWLSSPNSDKGGH